MRGEQGNYRKLRNYSIYEEKRGKQPMNAKERGDCEPKLRGLMEEERTTKSFSQDSLINCLEDGERKFKSEI